MKINYRKMSDEDIEKRLKELKIDMIKAGTTMGQSKVKKRKKEGSGLGSDIMKRLRKECARILTIKNERMLEKK